MGLAITNQLASHQGGGGLSLPVFGLAAIPNKDQAISGGPIKAVKVLVNENASESKQEDIWKCTIEYKKSEKTLAAKDSTRLKEILDEFAKKSKATTDEKESVRSLPMATFRFSKNGSEIIRYLSFHHEEPFTIEVAIGESKTRRVIHGDDKLLSKIKEIINDTFPKEVTRRRYRCRHLSQSIVMFGSSLSW